MSNIQAQTFFKTEKSKYGDIAIHHSVSNKVPNNKKKEVQEVYRTNQIKDITLMKIYVTNTVVEFDPSEKTFKQNLYRG